MRSPPLRCAFKKASNCFEDQKQRGFEAPNEILKIRAQSSRSAHPRLKAENPTSKEIKKDNSIRNGGLQPNPNPQRSEKGRSPKAQKAFISTSKRESRLLKWTSAICRNPFWPLFINACPRKNESRFPARKSLILKPNPKLQLASEKQASKKRTERPAAQKIPSFSSRENSSKSVMLGSVLGVCACRS